LDLGRGNNVTAADKYTAARFDKLYSGAIIAEEARGLTP
jgi:hypothetical protein